MLRSESSMGMPRFCSSNTRLNSSAIGPYFLGHKVQPGGQAVTGTEAPADQLDGLGHGLDELLDPFCFRFCSQRKGR